MRSSDQNKEKSAENSNSSTPSEDKSQFSDLSQPERSRKKTPPHKNTRGQKGKGRKSSRSRQSAQDRRKSWRLKRSDSSQETRSGCRHNCCDNPKRAKSPSTNNGSKVRNHKSGKITSAQLDAYSGTEVCDPSSEQNGDNRIESTACAEGNSQLGIQQNPLKYDAPENTRESGTATNFTPE